MDQGELNQTKPLRGNKERAAAEYAVSTSLTLAAKAAGVQKSTVWNWLQSDPDFVARLDQLRLEIARETDAALKGLGPRITEAINELLDIPVSEDAKESVSVSQRLDILKMAATLKPAIDPEELENEHARQFYQEARQAIFARAEEEDMPKEVAQREFDRWVETMGLHQDRLERVSTNGSEVNDGS